MFLNLFNTLLNTVLAILPLLVIIFVFQLFVIRRAVPHFRRVAVGFVLVILGLTFFLQGLDQALFPLGKLMAEKLTHPDFIYAGVPLEQRVFDWWDYQWVYAFGALLGFSTVIAEPALLAVAMKAREASGGSISVWGLRIAVACGVAIGVTLSIFRLVTGAPLHYYIIPCYVFVVIQTFFAPRHIIPLAYDSGGVTTSTVTVPLLAALGLGLASTVPGRSPLVDGFGMIAFACLFPIMTVMGYAQLAQFFRQRKRRVV